MLVFVIPLKSAKISKSWDLVCQLFERCVKSACNQTSSDFRVIVVCNEKPEIRFNHPKITYIEGDFPLPEPGKVPGLMDRGRKVLTGLVHAKDSNPSYAMIVDADDCVSNQLAEFASRHPQGNGWFVDKGYVYNEGGKFVYLRKKAFNRWCGTCHIINYNLYKLSVSTQGDDPYFYQFYGNHKEIKAAMDESGTPLQPLPFAGVVYTVGNGENMSQKNFSKVHNPGANFVARLADSLNYRPLTQSMRQEFCLYDLDL